MPGSMKKSVSKQYLVSQPAEPGFPDGPVSREETSDEVSPEHRDPSCCALLVLHRDGLSARQRDLVLPHPRHHGSRHLPTEGRRVVARQPNSCKLIHFNTRRLYLYTAYNICNYL